MRKLMKNPLIFDGRNILDPKVVVTAGFGYGGIDRGTICKIIPD
jgi:hypothetical protein